jgi:iron complex transport system substrate-binding protein
MMQLYHPRAIVQSARSLEEIEHQGSRMEDRKAALVRKSPGGRRFPARRAILLLAMLVLPGACERAAVQQPATQPANPTATTAAVTSRASVVTVASLVPAATDLILGMGAQEQLVAVSNFDLPDDRTRDLPRVGDYQTIDWEKLATVRPAAMVVQYADDRVPPGLRQRADSLGIKVVNIRNDTLAEVFETLELLAGAIGLPPAQPMQALRQRLDATKSAVAGKPPVPTLIVTDDSGQYAVGPDTYLDDLLTIAGGRNVLAGTKQRYLTIDLERLLAMQPQAIFVLRPGASPQEVDRARASMARLTQLPAVRSGRVYVLTEPWLLLPGWHVADIAETFARALHGEAARSSVDGARSQQKMELATVPSEMAP